jgi:hypothetical protein
MGLNPVDAAALLETCASFAASLTESGVRSIGVLVPAADTAAYPTIPLSAVTDFLLLRLEPGVPPPVPGPVLTRSGIRTIVGLRASHIGIRRVALMIPTHGYVWRPDSLPRAISYATAIALADDWRVPLVRDPASSAVYARSPAHGEMWAPDAETVTEHVRTARSMGIRRFAFIIGAGEDKRLWQALAEMP